MSTDHYVWSRCNLHPRIAIASVRKYVGETARSMGGDPIWVAYCQNGDAAAFTSHGDAVAYAHHAHMYAPNHRRGVAS